MSSTASNVSATPAVASSPWPQTAAASQDNGQDHSGGPFAALLDAAAAAPDTTNTQPQPAAPRTSTPTAANQLAAKLATRRHSGTAGAAQSAPSGAQAPADATKNANAAATPVASSNAAVDPSATPNATADQAGTALDIFAGAATTRFLVTDAAANAAAPDATTKTSTDNQDDSGSATDAGAVVAAATNVQVQPVAAAVITNTIITTPTAATAAAAPNMVIGSSATASAKSALPIVDAKTIASSQNSGDPLATPDAANASSGGSARYGADSRRQDFRRGARR